MNSPVRELRTNYPCDMHTHSNRSDGKRPPSEVIDHAAELGVRVLVLSDHDITPPAQIETASGQRSPCDYAREQGVYLLPGIEISCETEVEDVHLVCLGCDWNDPYFTNLERAVQQSKQKSYRELVDRIHEDGYPITWEALLTWNGRNIAPEQIQKKMIFEALSEIGFAETWSDAKKRVKATPRYQIPREKPPAEDTIREVHRTGGLVILAHPYLIADPVVRGGSSISRAQFIESLITAGLDGIEARYTYQKTSYTGQMRQEDIAEKVMQNYSSRLRIISGGSDYHGEPGKNGAPAREIGECGLLWDEFFQNNALRQLAERIYGEL